ncbi:MAG: DEAD/DEAH box helicase [Marinicellaceae bacterium]
MKFSSFGFAPEILKALDKCGYKDMTPVQEKVIALARKGKDLLVNAQTGTGKTAAFALPIIQNLLDKSNKIKQKSVHPKALILAPTRELAEQLSETIKSYSQFLDLNVLAVYGGVKISSQSNKLKSGVDILIATPARLIEHLELNYVSLSQVETLVLDEADRMLDMGFVSDVNTIIAHMATNHQTLLFSATTTPALNELSYKILRNHKEIRISKRNITAETVNHVMYPVVESRKIDLFMALLEEYNWYQVLVFTSTKQQANELLENLKKNKIKAAVCHADRSQGARRRALADFKTAKLQVLIATEVAARGIDIIGLDYVVNYNLPFLAEDYVHRIGRTGRAGQSGNAISFVSREEEQAVNRIERIIGSKIKRLRKKGFEVSDRETLINTIAQGRNLKKSNKPSETTIKKNKKVTRSKPKKSKKKGIRSNRK